MANRNFEAWLSTMKESIADYRYYIDFGTVYRNVSELKIELNILNSLIGSKNIEIEFKNLLARYPETLKAIPILIAKRESEIQCRDMRGSFTYNFSKMNQSIEQYAYFMRETGLFELLSEHLINNLIDYVIGVETGLNSNARKNRGGHLMEDLVETYLAAAGFIKDKTYFKEMYLHEIEKITGIDLSSLSNSGTTKKRFDFAIIKDAKSAAFECNFYSSSGSKLNETARSYKTLALESKGISGFKFVWITDGYGWFDARGNLQETFDVLDDLYNINDLDNGILNRLLD